MAQDNLQYDVDPIAFGSIAVGDTAQVVVTFTSAVDPTAARAITDITCTNSDITASPADGTFPGNGDTLVVTVTWTPTSAGTLSETLDVTHDFSYTTSPLEIDITGTAYSPEYDLPDIENNTAGVMKVTLIVDTSLPELTIPTANTIVKIGTLTELIDVEPGVVDIQNLDLEILEDYSTYTEGFWYKVIQGYPDKQVKLKFILEEGGTDTFFFFGKVFREEIEWPEHYVASDESAVIRSVRLRLVSLSHNIKDVSIDDAITEMLTHTASGNPFGFSGPEVLKLKAVFASIIAVAFDQTYSLDTVQVRGYDIRLDKGGGGGTVSPMDAYMIDEVAYMEVGLSGWRGYLRGDESQFHNPFAWKKQFADCFELIKQIALNFGWIARHYYGTTDGGYDAVTESNNQHRLEFLTRGTSYGSTVTPVGGLLSSMVISDSVTKAADILISDIQQSNDVKSFVEVNSTAIPVTFTTTHTLTRSDENGSWIEDGWTVGMAGEILGGTNDEVTITVSSVTDTVMVVSETLINASEETVDVSATSVAGGVEYDQTSGRAWVYKNAMSLARDPIIASESSNFPIKEPPTHASFELTIDLLFVRCPMKPTLVPTASYYRSLLYLLSGEYYQQFRTIDFYDYQAGDWDTGHKSMQNAVLKYYYNRFSPGRKKYERSYSSLQFTESGVTSQSVMAPMKRIEIDDVATTDTYYATEVRKDFMTDTTTVLWIQE